MVKEEFQATMEELCTKAAGLDRARREAFEAKSSVERLAEECNALRGDLQRQEAMVSQRDGVIAKLRDEALPDEEEAEEFVSKDEADPGVYSDTPNSVPLPSEPEVPVEAGSPLSPIGASPSDLHGLEACTTEAARSYTSNI